MPLLVSSIEVPEFDQAITGQLKIDIAGTRGKTQALCELAERLGDRAVVVRVPHHLDRSPYVLLELASACGAEALGRVADSLASSPSDPASALKVLDEQLNGHVVLVDDLDRLTGCSWELPGALRTMDEPVASWLERVAVARTRGGDIEGAIHTRGLQPFVDERWHSEALWNQIDQDADRYALAVARELLLGPHEAASWDLDALMTDLRDAMPTALRDLVSLLVVHERPLTRAALQALDAEERIIDAALEAMVLEHVCGQVWLPPVWYRKWPPTEHERRTWHGRLGESFATLANRDGDAVPAALAVLEAHRHFAEIPDQARATKFARYGTVLLLGAAKRTSLRGENRAATSMYAHVMALDAQARESGNPSGIGHLARAYAIHYQHYNAYRAELETPLETLAGYREALTLWPENALFWSRTIRCCFIVGRYDEALRARAEALRIVPNYPKKHLYLVARSTERLLARDLVLPALLAWGEHLSTSVSEGAVEQQLFDRLAQIWTVDRLCAGAAEWVMFRGRLDVSMRRSKVGCTFTVLGRDYTSQSPVSAVAQATRALRSELRSMAEDPSGEIDGAERRRQLEDSLDLDAARVHGDELLRWVAYWFKLDRCLAEGEVAQPQVDALRAVWRKARDAVSSVRRPVAGRSDDGGCYLSWSFADLPALLLTIDVDSDGRHAWFFRDADTGETEGTADEPEPRLPDRLFELLRRFAR